MMDTKEALKELEDLTVNYGNRNEEQIARLDEAIDMAIGALTAQPEKHTQERTETHACDLIDRQEAIDALDHMDYMPGEWHTDYDKENISRFSESNLGGGRMNEELIRKIELILIEIGQNDKKFRLGEIIKYSPSEVASILRKHKDAEIPHEPHIPFETLQSAEKRRLMRLKNMLTDYRS